MNRSIDREELLWEIGRGAGGEVAEADARAGTERLLAAYRRGELSPPERVRVEQALIASPALRRRLSEGAGIELPRLPEGLRERVLGRAASRRGTARHGWRLAAVLLVGVLAGGVGYLAWPDAEPEGARMAAFRVSVEALAERRSAPATGAAASRPVRPDTRVVIRVEPEAGASAGTEFALYREVDGALRRIDADDGLEVLVHRGAARFVATASSLVGATPGTRSVWVVAAHAGDLPDRLELAGETPPTARLAAGGRRFVVEQRLIVQQ